jgi:hypothetical protein
MSKCMKDTKTNSIEFDFKLFHSNIAKNNFRTVLVRVEHHYTFVRYYGQQLISEQELCKKVEKDVFGVLFVRI